VAADLLKVRLGPPQGRVERDHTRVVVVHAVHRTRAKAVDQPHSMYLAELALDMARRTLRPGGDFLAKVFQGEGFDPFLRELRAAFGTVAPRKPRASRARSAEQYLLARNYRG